MSKNNLSVELVEKNGTIDRDASVAAFVVALDSYISDQSEGLDRATEEALKVCQSHPNKRLPQDYIVNGALSAMNVSPVDYNRFDALVRRALRNAEVFSVRRGANGGTTSLEIAATLDAA